MARKKTAPQLASDSDHKHEVPTSSPAVPEPPPPETTSPGDPITISHAQLLSAIKRVIRVIRGVPIMPVLSHVKLAFAPASPPGLTVVATDLAATIEAALPYSGNFTGTIILPARTLANICKALTSYALPLTMTPSPDHATANLACGPVSYTLALADPDDFPELPAMPSSGLHYILSGRTFADLIGLTEYAASRDESRPVLCCVRLAFIPRGIEAIASDGFRAVIATVSSQSIPADNCSSDPFLVPRDTIALVKDLIDPAGQVHIALSATPSGSRQICFSLWDAEGYVTRVYSRLLELNYPDVHASIPESYEHSITVYRESFLNAVYRASAVAASRSTPVAIEIAQSLTGDAAITITMEADGALSHVRLSPADHNLPPKPEPTIIVINSGWLIQHLEHTAADRITIGFSDTYGPIIWNDVPVNSGTDMPAATPDAPAATHVIMPVRR